MSSKGKKPSLINQNRPSRQNGESPVSYLTEEFAYWQTLFQAQPALIQRFFEAQARRLADALMQPASQARFALPDRVIITEGMKTETRVPADQREQLVGGLMERLTRSGLNAALRQRMDELDASPEKAVAISSGLLRYAIASTLVNDHLPSGRSVKYLAADGEEIPTLPANEEQAVGSAITAATDAIAEEGDDITKKPW